MMTFGHPVDSAATIYTADGEVAGKLAYTGDTIHWAGGTWLAVSVHRPGHVQCHMYRFEAVDWLLEQAELYRATS